MQKPVILASSSTYRLTLLRRLIENIDHVAPQIDERSVSAETPHELVIKLALLKAQAIAEQCPNNSLIIGSDQLAILDGKELHKPGNRENNISQLAACSGKVVQFYTSVCVMDKATGHAVSDYDLTTVQFRNIGLKEITSYVEREPSYDCAGGFKVEGLGISLFESVKTEDPNALVGLPLIKLCSLLAHFGVNVL